LVKEDVIKPDDKFIGNLTRQLNFLTMKEVYNFAKDLSNNLNNSKNFIPYTANHIIVKKICTLGEVGKENTLM